MYIYMSKDKKITKCDPKTENCEKERMKYEMNHMILESSEIVFSGIVGALTFVLGLYLQTPIEEAMASTGLPTIVQIMINFAIWLVCIFIFVIIIAYLKKKTNNIESEAHKRGFDLLNPD